MRATIAVVAGEDRDVPPHTTHGGNPPNWLRAPSPDAHAPTVTTSGLEVPSVLGPRFDQGCTSPKVEWAASSKVPRAALYLVDAPTELTPLREDGEVTVPNPCPPLPLETETVVSRF